MAETRDSWDVRRPSFHFCIIVAFFCISFLSMGIFGQRQSGFWIIGWRRGRSASPVDSIDFMQTVNLFPCLEFFICLFCFSIHRLKHYWSWCHWISLVQQCQVLRMKMTFSVPFFFSEKKVFFSILFFFWKGNVTLQRRKSKTKKRKPKIEDFGLEFLKTFFPFNQVKWAVM